MPDEIPDTRLPGDPVPAGVSLKNLEPLPDDAITEGESQSAAQSIGQKLLPWQRDFARWMASRKTFPRRAAQYEKLREVAGREFTDQERRDLVRHPAFRAYFQIFQDRGVRAARARVEEVSLEAVNTLTWAMRKAKREDDYKAVPNIVGPIMERAMPRRDTIGMNQAQVTVVLTTQQLQDLDQPKPMLDVEIVED